MSLFLNIIKSLGILCYRSLIVFKLHLVNLFKKNVKYYFYDD